MHNRIPETKARALRYARWATWSSYKIKSSIPEAEHTEKLKSASATIVIRLGTHTSPYNRIAFIDQPSVHNFLLHIIIFSKPIWLMLFSFFFFCIGIWIEILSVQHIYDWDRVFSSRLLIGKRDLASGLHFKNTKKISSVYTPPLYSAIKYTYRR